MRGCPLLQSPEMSTSQTLKEFTLRRGDRRLPAALWLPPSPRGLVLACHGGSGHKKAPSIQAIKDALLPQGYGIAALDGPVHGERRADGSLDPVLAKNEFRSAWRGQVDRYELGEDYRYLLAHLNQTAGLADLPVGYIGVSMGTAYGIPLLAREPKIGAAVIGLWSTTYPASEHLAEEARAITCPVMFCQQWNDEAFERGPTLDLFDAIGSTDKRLLAYPGPHRELEGERLEDATAFLVKKLLAAR